MTVVILTGPPPWGFRLSGGSDFRRALTVTKVNVSSKAELANLRVGDVIMEINGERTTGMLHVQARNNIKSSRPQLKLLIHSVVALSRELVCQNQIFASQGLEASRESNENYSKQQYSSTAPVQNILPTLTSIPTIPTMPSMNPVVRKTDYIPNNNKSCDVPRQRHLLLDSEVYQRIHGRRGTPTDPRQSNTFHLIQEVLEEDCRNAALCTQEHPSTRPPSNPSLLRVQRFRTCESCGTLIVTQAIKIREGHHRHQECYTCRDCGLSLLKKGHFWVDKELYCGKHALQRYQRTG